MTTNDRFSDDRLREQLADSFPGPRAQAAILLEAPEAARSLIWRDAYRSMNMTGGRFSDNLRSSLAAWRRGDVTEERFQEVGRALRNR